jgi:predicted nucleotidyltransferase
LLTLHDLVTRRERLHALAERHGALRLRVFGSVARGDAGAGSDVDFVVWMEPGRSLLDLGRSRWR